MFSISQETMYHPNILKIGTMVVLFAGNTVLETASAASVTYNAFVAGRGWVGWVSDGGIAGTTGLGKQMEAVMVKVSGILPTNMKICYQSHVANKGWLPPVCNGNVAGTVNENRRMEAVKIWLENAPSGCSIEYKAHVANLGWLNPSVNGAIAGTVGQSRQMEAIQVSLKGTCDLPPQGKKGLTWGKFTHDATNGIDGVSCYGNGTCDPYQGDTACTNALPILCVKTDNSPRPNYLIPDSSGGSAMPKQYYRGWLGGHIATTLPVKGTELSSRQVADASCAAAFGDGWKMASHSDGKWVNYMDLGRFYGTSPTSPSPWPAASQLQSGGWAFFAYGNVTEKGRFWVNIGDQRGNCWDK